jgi:hypothetical protein
LELAQKVFIDSKIDFALIGGFALSAHGIHRATQDIDILADGSKKELIKDQLIKVGFQLVFESLEVMQFTGPGYLDVVLANRPLSLEMLKNTNLQIFGIPVVSAEGIIGLKIQAYKNDPSRLLKDRADIQDLLKISSLDLQKVKFYADLFNEWPEIQKLIP